ncbi:hypothetical protein [Candidatus Leptofilum sp.]|uniref:hypothetical protein n=1 Tax=Candidatus Leptofilum sp. TaxID=3241576 RepID=UPI003B5CF590
MTTINSITKTTGGTMRYGQMVRRGMTVACFLFPLLLLVSAVYRLLGEDTIYETSGFLSSNDIYIHNFLWLAWLAGIVAMLGLVQLIKDRKPMVAFLCTIFVFIGSVMQLAGYKGSARTADLRELGFDIFWNTSSGMTPSFFEAFEFTVLLWVIGVFILAVVVWQTAVLPKWVSLIAIVGTVAYAVSENVPGTIGGIITLITGICFALFFSLVGLRLWRGETAVV